MQNPNNLDMVSLAKAEHFGIGVGLEGGITYSMRADWLGDLGGIFKFKYFKRQLKYKPRKEYRKQKWWWELLFISIDIKSEPWGEKNTLSFRQGFILF